MYMSYKNLEMSLASNWISRDSEDRAYEGELGICASTELISLLNILRSENDNEDIITKNGEGNVWYSFCLHFDLTSGMAELLGFVKGSKKDDFCIYNLPMKKEDRRAVLRKVDAYLNATDETVKGVVA